MINAIKFSIEEIEASNQYFDHTGFSRLNPKSSPEEVFGTHTGAAVVHNAFRASRKT